MTFFSLSLSLLVMQRFKKRDQLRPVLDSSASPSKSLSSSATSPPSTKSHPFSNGHKTRGGGGGGGNEEVSCYDYIL